MIKHCKWCSKEMIKSPKITEKEFQKRVQTCSLRCGTFYMWHKCSKEEHEAKIEIKNCLHCGEPIPQRPGETYNNWKKRVTCNKSCAGFLKKGRPQKKKEIKKTEAEAAGVIHIKPGSERFEELRRMYERRDNLQTRGCRL